MNAKKSGWRVGDIAKRAGISVATIHFYEAKGLISSWRDGGNQRRFEPSVLRQIAVIKSAHRLGISLQEIAAELSTLPKDSAPSTSDWKRLSTKWRQSLQQRIDQLQQLRDELDECIGCGCLSIKACKLRNPEDQAAKKGSGAVFWKT